MAYAMTTHAMTHKLRAAASPSFGMSFTDVLSTLAATEEEKRAFLGKLSRAELARMLGLWELRGPRQRASSCSDPSWTTWLFLGGRSPDRLDALVWALTHLMLGGAEPRVRVL
jgi:hypothetical protein